MIISFDLWTHRKRTALTLSYENENYAARQLAGIMDKYFFGDTFHLHSDRLVKNNMMTKAGIKDL